MLCGAAGLTSGGFLNREEETEGGAFASAVLAALERQRETPAGGIAVVVAGFDLTILAGWVANPKLFSGTVFSPLKFFAGDRCDVLP